MVIQMTYLKKIINSLSPIIITYILQLIIVIISCSIYKLLTQKELNTFINNYLPIILIIFYLITILYLKNKTSPNISILPIKKYYILILTGISISCLLNMFIFLLTNTPSITSSINPIILIISSGIIGPIYEEILFRQINLTKLQKFNTPRKSIILNSLIFALIHLNPIKIFYAFILGIILSTSYQKNNNLQPPIIIHISANLISLLLTEYSRIILILSILGLIICQRLTNPIKNIDFSSKKC